MYQNILNMSKQAGEFILMCKAKKIFDVNYKGRKQNLFLQFARSFFLHQIF